MILHDQTRRQREDFPTRPDRREHGATLIEILVVCAVILTLFAILFPVLTRAKESAKAPALASTLRQVSAAWAIYDPDNYDKAPSVTRLYDAGLVGNDLLHRPDDPEPLGEGTMYRLSNARLLRVTGSLDDRLDLAGPSRSSVYSYGDLCGWSIRAVPEVCEDTDTAQAHGAKALGYFVLFREYPPTVLKLYFGGRRCGTPLLRAAADGAVLPRRLLGGGPIVDGAPKFTYPTSAFFDSEDFHESGEQAR